MVPTQQVDLVNSQLVATQQQLEQLQQRHQELSVHHSMLVQELIGVQKAVVNHEHVMQNVMSYLHSVDARQRRDSKIGGPFAQTIDTNGQSTTNMEPQQQVSPLDDEPASPLQNASKLLSDLNADEQLNMKTLEHMNNDLASRGTGLISTPPPEGTRPQQKAPTSAASSVSLSYSKPNLYDCDTLVYPVGQTNGIDPMYSEHLPNIPYSVPPKDTEIGDGRNSTSASRKKSTAVDPGWTRPPQILLVEDDPTCRRIGSKFLYSFHCAIDSAVSFGSSLAVGCTADVFSLTVSRLSTR